MADGTASTGLLQDLWRAVLDVLLVRIRARKPALGDLQVARRFLRDNGCFCPDEASRERLEELYRVYLRRLQDAMETRPHSAALLKEARAFLQWHGVGDIPGTAAKQAAKQLLELDVPFKNVH